MTTVVSYGSATARPPRSIAQTAIAAQLKRPWSHGRAYVPIVAIVLLVFASLIVLHLHWFAKKLLNAIAS